jgi:hypothetical protein
VEMCASKARMDISLAYSVLALPTFANFGLRVYGQPRHTWGHSRSMPVLLSGHSKAPLCKTVLKFQAFIEQCIRRGIHALTANSN